MTKEPLPIGTKVILKSHKEFPWWDGVPSISKEEYLKHENSVVIIEKAIPSVFDKEEYVYEFVGISNLCTRENCFDVIEDDTLNFSIEDFQNLFD